ncbi:CYFA0S14e00914g1_1 [Cyberlindnera fabianii]|uniref:CYFA0S14e00914g1_1 n=1 Tax=Cyberlindnera fabianii TaxID=36022 RepID=A0A061B8K1_CYBFA|nr:CYFA0S14e00914g1_1 [Cyberlindnera fabianii]
MPLPPGIPAPIPQRNPLIAANNDLSRSLPRPGSGMDFVHHVQNARLAGLSRTPDPSNMPQHTMNDQSDELLLQKRLQQYNLDYPENEKEFETALLDKDSRWFGLTEPRKLNVKKLLPYKTETHLEQAQHLCHIVVHLYIAIKSLDLEGYVHISAKDLASVKNDIELTLETDLFNADLLSMDAEDNDGDEGDEEDEEVKSSGVIGKVLPRSATIVSVNHWTNELKSCLKMKFELPVRLRASLAKVYFSLCFSRGQDIKLGTFVDMFTSLVSGYRNELTEMGLLKLDHKRLLDHYSQFFPDPDPTFNIYNPLSSDNDKNIFSDILKVGMYASPYFEPQAMKEVFDWSMQRYSVSTGYLSLQVLSHTIPTLFEPGADVIEYIPSIMHFWSNSPALKSRQSENNIIHLLSRIVTRAYYIARNGDTTANRSHKYGVLTETQMRFVLHRLLGNLRQEFYTRSYTQFAGIIILSVTPENFADFFDMLKTLLGSLETFVHPSNSGGWSSQIAKFCFKFIHRYHKRVMDEAAEDCELPKDLKLTQDMNKQIVTAFTDILLLGSQSKKETHSNYYISSLGYLADIFGSVQNKVIDTLLIDLYDSLTDQFVNSSHRVIVSLKQLTEVVRFMVLIPAYRPHLTNILSLVVSKIGTNDMTLTNHAINAFLTFVAIVPVMDATTEDDFISFESSTVPYIQEHLQFIKDHPDETWAPDTEITYTALKASTMQFKDIVGQFIQKLLLLLETELNEKIVFKITQTMLILTQSISEDIFNHITKIIHDKLLEGDFSAFKENEAVFANMVAALVKWDNSLSPKYFAELDKLIRYELEQGAGSVRNDTSDILDGDIKLVVYLIVLSEVLSVSNGEIVKFQGKLVKLLRLLYTKVTNPSLSSVTAYVLHKTLKNLTNVKLRENRLLVVEPSKTECLDMWGAYQFDDSRFDEKKLQFDWYVPGSDEVHCAIEIFETCVMETLTSLEEGMKVGEMTEILSIDHFIKDLRLLGASLSGASMLFDPDFTNETSEVFNRTSLEKKLMILKSLRASKTDENEMNIDIEQITNKEDSPDFAPYQNVPLDNTDGIPEPSNDQDMEDIGLTHDDEMLSSSVLLTPSGAQDNDMDAVMNPAIAFAQSKNIYNCNYFFGSTAEEKKSKLDYGHIHSLRSMVGQALHKVFLFLSQQKTENSKLFQNFLQVFRTYFSDVGKESTFDVDDQLFIDYVFMKKVLAAGNHKKPFTRTCFGARAEKFHRQRVILFSTNRFPTKLDKLLILDLVKLATSPYETTSSTALGALLDTMRKIIGSYRVIITLLISRFEELLNADDHKGLEAVMKVLRLSKISNKLSSDYQLLQKLFVLLDRCLRHTEPHVSEIAKTLILLFSGSIKVPSAVALFDHDAVDSIRPPDKCIDLEIAAVKNAKDDKRKVYITQLNQFQDFVCVLIKSDDHWMYKYIYLSMLTQLQEYYELETKDAILKMLVTEAQGHPSLIWHCIKSFSKLVDKVTCFALFGYDMENSFRLNFMRPGMTMVDTSKNFSKIFRSEMKNFENPSFYFDGKIYGGWLFWGDKLKALTTEKSYDYVRLSESDKTLLKNFGSLITRQWLSGVLKSVTIHNESKAVFQLSEVYLISSVVQLSTLGFTSITYKDVIDLITEVYDKDDKASVILCAEIVAGLFVASNHTSPEDEAIRDKFLDPFLEAALTTNLTPDTRDVWSIVGWWLPTRVDFRRIPVLYNKFSAIKEFMDPTSNQAFVQSSRLMFSKSYITNLGWQFQNSEEIMSCLEFTHPYKIVRDQLAEIQATLTYCFFAPSFQNADQFINANNVSELGYSFLSNLPQSLDDKLTKLFHDAEFARGEIATMTPQDALHSNYFYYVTSILQWIRSLYGSPLQQLLVPYLAKDIFPFLMNVEANRELCKLGNISLDHFVLLFAGGLFCRPDQIPDVMTVATVEYDSTHQLLHQLSFIEGFFNRQLLLLTSEQKLTLIGRIDQLLFHSSIEVRVRAAAVLTGIIHNTRDLESVNSFIEKYKKTLNKKKPKKELTTEKMIKVHGATIGLGALVSAFPYVSPPPAWMPENIVLLARASSFPGAPGKAAKDVLSNFKKLRADTWHIDRASFTEQQLADLEGVLWSSYFA